MSSSHHRARAYVALGSNLQDPLAQVRSAMGLLAHLPDTELTSASRCYRTPPWGRVDQPAFVNAVVALDTALSPEALLNRLQMLEAAAGRARIERWGPRVLDLDLLLHGEEQRDGASLQLPHPHIARRAFVLVPLAEIAPALTIPRAGPVAALLDALDPADVAAVTAM